MSIVFAWCVSEVATVQEEVGRVWHDFLLINKSIPVNGASFSKDW